MTTLETARRPSLRLEPFDYADVRLLPGRFADQVHNAAHTYGAIPNDSILKGFREQAGLDAPGEPMGGWCSVTSGVIFGQLVSGLARMGSARNEAALRDKAVDLVEGWQATVADGDVRMDTYAWEKLVCGLVDVHRYTGYDTMPVLEKATAWAATAFDRSRSAASELDFDGRRPAGTLEWYTLPENLYRGYLASGLDALKEFADLWLYTDYWDAFEQTARPAGLPPVHAYSHVNSFSSAAMAYAVSGDEYFLHVITNAFEYLQQTQCYATGAYGAGERLLPADGRLGLSLELQTDSAEVPCGSWAGFKLARYLMSFTGEARYGDWIEALLFNAIGAALPTQPDGRTFYYADYHLPNGAKHYFWDRWPCCAGTYLQAVADYHNLLYFHAPERLFVNLFLPSEVDWTNGGQRVRLRQETEFPTADTTHLTVDVERPARFTVSIRVPTWADRFRVEINGEALDVATQPGTWADVERNWQSGDRLTFRIGLDTRVMPIDEQHPRRVALGYGPLVLAQDARAKRPLRTSADQPQIVADPQGRGLLFLADDHSGPSDRELGAFVPLYDIAEAMPHRIYVDLDGPCLY